MPMQLHYVQLITDKTNATDRSGVVTQTIKIQNPLPFLKFRQKLANKLYNKWSTELYCLFIATDSIVNTISFIRCIVV